MLEKNEIEIPGFAVRRLIRSETVYQVWEALDVAADLKVAIKSIDLSLLSEEVEDSVLDQLFARQDYPESVGPKLLDSLRIEGQYYQIFEYIDGVNLRDLLYQGISIAVFNDLISHVLRALGRLHDAGLFHGDLTPENIVVDDDGEVFLLDGAPDVRSLDIKAESLGNLFKGATSSYASPQFKTDRLPTVESDRFSLGILILEALTGDLPSSELSSDQRKGGGGFSRLPEQFKGYQGFLDTLFGVEGNAESKGTSSLASGLSAQMMDTEPGEVRINTAPVSEEEIRLLGASLFEMNNEVRTASPNKRVSLQSTGWIMSLVGVILIGLAWVISFRADLIPEPIDSWVLGNSNAETEAARIEAQSLREDPNQGLSTKLAAYNRLINLAPDDPKGYEDLESIKSEWIASINQALSEGRYSFAEARLEEAEAVLPQDPRLIGLSIGLQNWQRAESLFEASRERRLGFVDDEVPLLNSLIASYQNVLRLAPNHQGAVRELNLIAVRFSILAREAFDSKDLSTTLNYLERAQSADPSVLALSDVKELLFQTRELKANIQSILDEAQFYFSQGQLVSPAEENALNLYNQVLVVDPNNIVSKQKVSTIIESSISLVESRILQGDLNQAEDLLNEILGAGAPLDVIRPYLIEISEMREKTALVNQGLDRARLLINKGYITQPPRNNAVAELREVERIDPDNVDARLLLEECSILLVTVARDARKHGYKELALKYLELAIRIKPNEEDWLAMRAAWST